VQRVCRFIAAVCIHTESLRQTTSSQQRTASGAIVRRSAWLLHL